jgi:hypothetical protein
MVSHIKRAIVPVCIMAPGWLGLWLLYNLVTSEGQIMAFVLTVLFGLLAVGWCLYSLTWSERPQEPATAPLVHTAIRCRSNARHDEMTPEEQDYFADTVRRVGRPGCPDCGRPLYRGPEGCGSYNWGCRGCGSEFNCMLFRTDRGSVACWGQRISDPGPRALGERDCVYGCDPPTPNELPATEPPVTQHLVVETRRDDHV